MIRIDYTLFPEAYKAKGQFIEKNGTVGELLEETGILLGSDYDKVIPPLEEINRILLKGDYPRAGEWEPITLDDNEYEEVVDDLCNLQLLRPYRRYDSA